MKQLYAIRHKKTGHFIPRGGYRERKSALEPQADCIPRLFTRLSAARTWLTVWLKGEVVTVYGYTNYDDPHPEADVKIIPRPHRDRELMEIVPVTLKFGEPVV